VELRLHEVASARERHHVSVVDAQGNQRRLEVTPAEPTKPAGHGLLGFPLQPRMERRVDLPVRWPIAAEYVAELLPDELLGVTVVGPIGPRVWSDAQPRCPRSLLVRLGDEAFFAHAAQHDVTAFTRTRQVAPRRQRRRTLNEAGDERALGDIEAAGRLAEKMPRHLLD